jgi:FkbM family methyltransferase
MPTRPVRRFVRRCLHRAGWELIRYPGRLPGRRRQLLLTEFGIDLVVDVGANVGQYARELRSFGYADKILSFEPMRAAFSELSTAAHRSSNWDVVQCALGDQPGRATINVAGNSVSSSLLPMLARHSEAAPRSTYVRTEEVRVERLDVAAGDQVRSAHRPFLKIDTQGFEKAVLSGAGDLLAQFIGIEIEMSLTPLYGDQMLMLDTIAYLAERGFSLAGLADGLSDSRTGETLQADGIFIRR